MRRLAEWRQEHPTPDFVLSVLVFFALGVLLTKAFDPSGSWSSCVVRGLLMSAIWAALMCFVIGRRAAGQPNSTYGLPSRSASRARGRPWPFAIIRRADEPRGGRFGCG